MAEPFTVGAYYTNEEIAAATGSAAQHALRYATGKRIVALCLNAWEHPNAPAEVWVGAGGMRDLDGRAAQWLVDQCAAEPGVGVPLFIKEVATQGGPRSWRYHGRYRVAGETRDAAALAALARRRKDPVVRILFLARVPD